MAQQMLEEEKLIFQKSTGVQINTFRIIESTT